MILSYSPITITTADQLGNVIADISSKVMEKELAIKQLLQRLFNGEDYDYQNRFSIDGNSLKNGYVFVTKVLSRDSQGIPVKTKPFILILSNCKLKSKNNVEKEFKAGDILPHHECSDYFDYFPSVLGETVKKIHLLSKVMNLPYSTIESLKSK